MSLGQPTFPVDYTGYPCLATDMCRSAGDASLVCCRNLPGAPGGTCATATSCASSGYAPIDQGSGGGATEPEEKKASVPIITALLLFGAGFAAWMVFKDLTAPQRVRKYRHNG